jgi:hypothetical protein
VGFNDKSQYKYEDLEKQFGAISEGSAGSKKKP